MLTTDTGTEVSQSRTHSREASEKTTKEIIDQKFTTEENVDHNLKARILKDKNDVEKKKMRKNLGKLDLEENILVAQKTRNLFRRQILLRSKKEKHPLRRRTCSRSR